MAEREVEVVAVATDGLRLRLLGSACDGCSGGCGGRCSLFGGDAGGELALPAPSHFAVQAGQRLRLVLDDRRLRSAAWQGYGRAWLGLVLGAFAGRAVALAWPAHADLLTLAGLVSGTFLAMAFSKRHLPEPQLQAMGEFPPSPPCNSESTHP